MMPRFRPHSLIVLLLGLAATFAATLSAAPAKPTFAAYTWHNVPITGGGFVSGIVFNTTQPGLVYARTDVGGSYRWLPDEARWLPLNDDLGPEDTELLGIVSLATDPIEPQRVYLAAGQYLPEWAKNAAILHSSDYGTTWQRTPLPIKLGGNADGRSTGERLQIDPHKNNRLLLGTNQDGLWLSDDFALTWKKIPRFPAASITFTLFDQLSGTTGQPTPIIYVGVNDLKGTALFRSADAGKTWSPVPGQPSGLIAHHAAIAADGTLFLTCGNYLGPNDVTRGAVWKYSPTDNRWTDISPAQPGVLDRDTFGYAGLALDTKNPGTLLVSTLNRWTLGDEIFRSTDSGTTWKPILSSAPQDTSAAPYVAKLKPHWIGDLDLDPFDSSRAYFITGYGIFGTDNATAADSGGTTRWTFAATNGIEETVPLALISPPEGAPLVSAIGDFGGFRHDDLNAVPPRGAHTLMHGTNLSIEFAENVPAKIVRTHSGPSRASLSLDGAATWTDFPSAPDTALKNGQGKITISSDGKTLLWLPKKSAPFFSTDDGTTWTASTGAFTSAADYRNDTPVADRVDSSKFYLYDQTTGTAYFSHDGARSFKKSATRIPAAGTTPKSVPGHNGHIWIPTESGIYRSTDGGVTYSKLENIVSASALGFGKPAADQRHPAIYLAGKIPPYHALFRSDDGGFTWLVLNTTRTRFGFINAITGDPRTHGRVYLGTGGRGILVGEPAR